MTQRVHHVARRHPARHGQANSHRLVAQWQKARQKPPVPHAIPRHQALRRKRRCKLRTLALLALVVPGLLWVMTQAPRVLPFTARYGGQPGLLLLAVLALVVLGGLKSALLRDMLLGTQSEIDPDA